MKRIKCPACNTPTLSTYHIGSWQLEKCRSCGGLWFDEPELTEYIETHANDPSKGFNLVDDATSLGKSTQHCHTCDIPMEQLLLIENHTVVIDTCNSCKSFWVEHQHIQHVKHSHDLRDALEEIHKGFSWYSWLFQIIMKMPVEYNAKPHATPWITYTLILLNLLLFLPRFIDPAWGDWTMYQLTVLIPIYDSAARFMASLITAQFVHGDLMHIIGNLYFLWIIGDNIEDALGKTKFILAYLITGTIGILAEAGFALIEQRELVLMGASAAVSGLFGMYIIWFRHAKLSVMLVFYQFRLRAYWFLGIWVITNLYGLFSGGFGVAYVAHLGGFIAGLVFALLYQQQVYRNNPLLYLLNNRPANNT